MSGALLLNSPEAKKGSQLNGMKLSLKRYDD